MNVLICLAVFMTPAFAGRAFPVDSENFAVDLFSKVNSRLEWDPTNFLVDLSGRYALCKHLGIDGAVDVQEITPEGSSIGGLTASYLGSASDANAVKAYIKQDLPGWLQEPQFLQQIERAERFGCSVQPACRESHVISCLFSPRYKAGPVYTPPPLMEPTGVPKAQAFTPEQYEVTEKIIGRKWDRSHFLENLSGQETDCAMMVTDDWSFPIARPLAAARGLNIEPLYGVAVNNGHTEPAMIEILEQWKPTFQKFQTRSSSLGCSIIPDCMDRGSMFVVVSCIISF